MIVSSQIEIISKLEDFLTPIQNNLIKILENDGPLTRRELVKLMETPRTTIYDNLIKLQKQKVVENFSRTNGNRGRPLVLWKLNN